ncbi:cardioacceleratory peptide receptor 1 [Tribolium castaneum]|uniref:CCAP-like G protein-coupled receptor 2 n=1 Tax=Tribolium castaneum TaxID=7070 RepID=A3RE79_TRICA|nr:cardioacceleratory peptide receptor 1 [Tribolium castaneum]ABN79651.1 cardioactive peptide receptor 1 [Tribolium castaneum]DAA64485.1 TPA_inf: CCAP-like G protein-coupled receptor 2 [Tribolium castaneum]|eukprot:NP_001076796.1 cardioacceleratory peptide receptor 1 [Tribolium castaneum]
MSYIEDANETDSNNTSLDAFYFFETEQFTLLWVLFVIIVAGNVGVLYTLLFGRSRKSRMNYFITHLALADLSVGLINVLTDIIWKTTVAWYAGNVACKVIRFLQVVVTYASTYVLVALSIDRYDAIRHPMKFSGSWKRARYLILAAWFFSALYSLPILIFYEEKIVKGKLQCWIEFHPQWKWQVYMTLVSLSLFIIPASIIATCYAIIIITIWSKNAKGFIKNTKAVNGSDNSRRASSRGLIPRAKVKTIKITFVIVSVFILCWSPYIIFDLLQVFGQIPGTQTNIAIATFIQSLAPLNSAANPIIYCLFSTHFCRTLGSLPPFKWLFKKKKRRNRESTTNTQSSSLSEFLTNTHKRKIENTSTTFNAHTVLIH